MRGHPSYPFLYGFWRALRWVSITLLAMWLALVGVSYLLIGVVGAPRPWATTGFLLVSALVGELMAGLYRQGGVLDCERGHHG